MNTSRQALFDSSTASRANLRSAVGIYLNKLSTSVLCFVREDAHELSPTSITNTTSKMMITNHIFYAKVFNGYPTIILDQIISHFVSEVSTLPFDFEMFLCQEFDSLAPIEVFRGRLKLVQGKYRVLTSFFGALKGPPRQLFAQGLNLSAVLGLVARQGIECVAPHRFL